MLLGEDEVRAPRAVVGLEDGLGGAHGVATLALRVLGWRPAPVRARALSLADGCGEGVGVPARAFCRSRCAESLRSGGPLSRLGRHPLEPPTDLLGTCPRRRTGRRRPRPLRHPGPSPSRSDAGRGHDARGDPRHHARPHDPRPRRHGPRPPAQARPRPGGDPGAHRLPRPRCPGPSPPPPPRSDAAPEAPGQLRGGHRPHQIGPRGRVPRPLRAPRPPAPARQRGARDGAHRRLRVRRASASPSRPTAGSWHRGRAAFERDRERDAILATKGYLTLRFTDRQIENDPRTVARALTAALTAAPGMPRDDRVPSLVGRTRRDVTAGLLDADLLVRRCRRRPSAASSRGSSRVEQHDGDPLRRLVEHRLAAGRSPYGAITSASTFWASRFSTRSICSMICVSYWAAFVSDVRVRRPRAGLGALLGC